MSFETLRVGKDCFVAKEKVLFIFDYASKVKPKGIKKSIEAAELLGKVENVTKGEKTKSVVVCDDGYFILSSTNASTLNKRFSGGED